jgi:hypothetical protein
MIEVNDQLHHLLIIFSPMEAPNPGVSGIVITPLLL